MSPFHDFKKGGVPPARLDAWIAAVGWEALVNRKGTDLDGKLDESVRIRGRRLCFGPGVDARPDPA